MTEVMAPTKPSKTDRKIARRQKPGKGKEVRNPRKDGVASPSRRKSWV
jgi:hypothetical protein